VRGVVLAVATAVATFRVIHARASGFSALKVLAVATAVATFRVIHARASEFSALKLDAISAPEDSLRGEPARASKLRSRLRALKLECGAKRSASG